MNDSQEPVEKLSDSLYSRNYKPAEDVRTPVHEAGVPEEAPEWHDPSLDDMLKERRMATPKPSLMKKVFTVSIIFFVVAIAAAGYIFWGGANFISSKNVDISVNGPVTAAAGDPVTLAITIRNLNNADLTSADLSVTYPDGTRNASDTSQTLMRDKASLGTVAAGQSGTASVSASFFGETGTIETVTLHLDYTVSGSSAVFSKEKTYAIALGTSPVDVSVSQPDSITAGTPFSTVVTVATNSSDVVRNIVLKADYPYGFQATSEDPAAGSNDNFWTLGDLAPGQKKTITIKGVLSGVNEDQRTFRFQAGVADSVNASVLSTSLAAVSHTVALSRPSVGVSIALNGSSDTTYTAPAGGNVSASVHFQNNSTSKLTNAKISLKFSGALDPSTVSVLSGGFYDSNTNTITWTSDNLPSLASVAPGDSVDVSASFASAAANGSGSKEVDVTASASGVPLGAGSSGALSSSAAASVKIASEVALSARSLYSRGPFKNTGPIPPKASATTTYTVYFDLGNTENDINDGKLTAKLGPNVAWTNAVSASAENVSYDLISNTVSWDVGKLESGAGYTKPLREAAFQVSITPSLGQLRSTPNLVSAISFSGTDSFTDTPVNVTTQNVTTAITTDPSYTQGDEMVVK